MGRESNTSMGILERLSNPNICSVRRVVREIDVEIKVEVVASPPVVIFTFGASVGFKDEFASFDE